MNTMKLITKTIVMMCFFVCSIGSDIFAATTPSNTEIQKRIDNLNTVIDTKLTEEVTDYINRYVVKRRKDAEAILGRTSLYFPYIENIIRDKELPDELKYIAVIESSLNPSGTSHQGAAGIWQFMKGTAELYGLTINKYVDERKDLVKSTDKALDHLQVLYNLYNDWTLAIAAYNCGSGTINRAIKKANGETDFWKIRKYLPKETQNYIPKFIATAYLMNYYYLHDLQPKDPSDEMKYVLTIKVNNSLDIERISKEFEIDPSLIKYLNPTYSKNTIPSSAVQTLTLPDTKMLEFIGKYGGHSDIVPNPYGFCRVRYVEGEGVFAIECEADKKDILTHLSSKSIAVRDNIKSNKHIKDIAQKLEITQIAKTTVLHRLTRKESLMDLAENHNMTLNDLLAINNIDPEKGIAPGSLIRVYR